MDVKDCNGYTFANAYDILSKLMDRCERKQRMGEGFLLGNEQAVIGGCMTFLRLLKNGNDLCTPTIPMTVSQCPPRVPELEDEKTRSYFAEIVRRVNAKIAFYVGGSTECTYEYPEYLNLGSWNFGTVNGVWGWEENNPDLAAASGSLGLPPNAPAETVAEAIYLWYCDAEFRVACRENFDQGGAR